LLFTSQFAAKLQPNKIHWLHISGLLLFDAQLNLLSIDQRKTAAAIFLSCFGLAVSKQKNTFRTKFTQVILPVFQWYLDGIIKAAFFRSKRTQRRRHSHTK
jgi:hypothetical protein